MASLRCYVFACLPCFRAPLSFVRRVKTTLWVGLLMLLVLFFLENLLHADRRKHDGDESLGNRGPSIPSSRKQRMHNRYTPQALSDTIPVNNNKETSAPQSSIINRSNDNFRRTVTKRALPSRGHWRASFTKPTVGPTPTSAAQNKLPPKELPGGQWQVVAGQVRRGYRAVVRAGQNVFRGAPRRGKVRVFPPASSQYSRLPVQRAARPTSGEPWPAPQNFKSNSSHLYGLPARHMPVQLPANPCRILTRAVDRMTKVLEKLFRESQDDKPIFKHDVTGGRVLSGLEIYLQQNCTRSYPSLESDESYELFIRHNSLVLRSQEVWGILHGLETFYQLLRKINNQLVISDVHITDFPRFKHRGIMIDTARHYLHKSVILRNLDAMAMNKLNVLHWHLVDDQSFPYASKAFPELSKMGAYSAKSVYTLDDISEIVEYARERGIRVIPELDTPGHTTSWIGLPHLLTPCDPPGGYGPIDPTRNTTYEHLTALFLELLRAFPDGTLHFGGDECSYYCWSKNKNITAFMISKNMAGDFQRLFNYYFTRLHNELTQKVRWKTFQSIYWQEVFHEGVTLHPDAIVHVWKDDYQKTISEVTRAGHRVVLSSCWYLNYISYGSDWHKYYLCDPQQFSGSRGNGHLVIGGEACMWGEYVDETNLLTELWPRASAVAERLWSSRNTANPYFAEGRFEENRCRMFRRGIPTRPMGGPGPPCNDFRNI